VKPDHSFHVRPTGTAGSYRRLDYLRGAAMAAGWTILLAGIAWLASRGPGWLIGLSFLAVTVGILTAIITVILIAQAAIGSTLPVSFLAPRDAIPEHLRSALHQVLREHWVAVEEANDEDVTLWAVEHLAAELYDAVARGATIATLVGVIERIEHEDERPPSNRGLVAERFHAAVVRGRRSTEASDAV